MAHDTVPAARSWPRRFSYWLVCLLIRAVGGVFLQVRTRGLANYPPAGGALVCANHQSFLDPLLIGGNCPRRMNFLARESLFHGGLGWLIRWFDAIPLQREGLGIGGIKESLRRLRRGELLLIFPEGTRTEDGLLQSLEAGFIALARRGSVPIVPVAIDGAFQAWPRGARYPKSHPVSIVVGPLIPVDQIAATSDADLIEVVAGRIRDCWTEAHRQTQSR